MLASRDISAGATRPVSIGDEVFATGKLVSSGGIVRLGAVGRGLYGKFLEDAGDISVGTDLDPELASDTLVTVRGIWADDTIRDSHVVELVDPIEMPEPFGDQIDSDLVPDGRFTKEEVVAPAVFELTRGLGHEKLLFYSAHKLSDGWIGVACTTDSAAVEKALARVLGNALAIVDVEWTAQDLEMIDEWVMGDKVGADLLSFGQGMNSAGQFRSYVLVRVITPETASALAPVHPDALLLTSWIQKS